MARRARFKERRDVDSWSNKGNGGGRPRKRYYEVEDGGQGCPTPYSCRKQGEGEEEEEVTDRIRISA